MEESGAEEYQVAACAEIGPNVSSTATEKLVVNRVFHINLLVVACLSNYGLTQSPPKAALTTR